MLRDILLQICQVVAVLTLAPLLQGVIHQFEERVQLAQGPGFFSRTAIFGSCSISSLSSRKLLPGSIGLHRSSRLPQC